MQVKDSEEATILCLTAIGNIKLKQKEMDATKVSTQIKYATIAKME